MSHVSWDGVPGAPLAERGEGVVIGAGAVITDPGMVKLGDRVRIDPFVYISGAVEVGSDVQICAGAVLIGRGGITLGDWTFVGYGSKVLSCSEDPAHLVNDHWGAEHANCWPVRFERFAGIYSDVLVMPGVTLKEGVRIGAKSIVHQSPPLLWSLYYGRPLKRAAAVDRWSTTKAARRLGR